MRHRSFTGSLNDAIVCLQFWFLLFTLTPGGRVKISHVKFFRGRCVSDQEYQDKIAAIAGEVEQKGTANSRSGGLLMP